MKGPSTGVAAVAATPDIAAVGPVSSSPDQDSPPPATGPRWEPPSLSAGLVLPVISTALTLAAGVITGQVLLALTVLTVPAALTATGIAVISHRSQARSGFTQASPTYPTDPIVRVSVSCSSRAADTAPALPATPVLLALPAAPIATSTRPAVMRITLGGPVRSTS